MEFTATHYDDYRECLQSYFEYRMDVQNNFSIRSFTLKANIKSMGFYRELLQGKRQFTQLSLNKTLQALPWSDIDKQYFESLVWFQQTKDSKMKEQYLSQLLKIKQINLDTSLPDEKFEFYSQWIHSLVREMLEYPQFNENLTESEIVLKAASWIQQHSPLKLKISEIVQSIQWLLAEQIILRDGGQFIQSEVLLSAPQDWRAPEIKFFQAQMLHKAMEVLPLDVSHPKQNSSTTLTLSRNQFERAQEAIRTLRHELMNLAVEIDGAKERVYQFNSNLFALSSELKRGEKV